MGHSCLLEELMRPYPTCTFLIVHPEVAHTFQPQRVVHETDLLV